MILCLDAIQCVKRKHKSLKIERSLSAKRSRLTRSLDTSRYSKVSHSLGQGSNFKFGRDIAQKVAKVEQEKPDLRTPSKSSRMNVSFDCSSVGGPNTSAKRNRSFDVSQRLLGYSAFQTKNRHSKE